MAIIPNGWTRFSRACSATAVSALAVSAFLALGAGGGAWAQTAGSADEVVSTQTDEVTTQILQDPYLQLRFIALSMESADEQGTALNGLVQAMLVQGDIDRAIAEADLIEDPLWYARSQIEIAGALNDLGAGGEALDALFAAVERLEPVTDDPDAQAILALIAAEQAGLNALPDAIATATLIPDARQRVAALEAAAVRGQAAGDGAAASNAAIAEVLRETVAEAARLPTSEALTGRLLTELGLAQVKADDPEGAKRTFALARAAIAEGPESARDIGFARLGAALVAVEDRVGGMQVVRDVPEGPERAIALSGIARTMALAGDMDSAQPIFTLAREIADGIDPALDPDGHERAFTAIVADFTVTGQLLDAFTAAGAIPDRLRQSRALMRMAEVLLDQERYDDAIKLVDYIPFIAMRARIFAAVARAEGEAGADMEASALLARALEPTGFDPQPALLPDALRDVLTMQLRHGAPESDEALFIRARELADLIPDDLQRVRSLTRLAIAEGSRGFLERADRTLSSAYRIAFLNREADLFGEAMADITGAQLEIGDLLEAFDSAARIPDPTAGERRDTFPDGRFSHPKYRALTAVAATAVARGRLPLGRRAANQIAYPPARAAAFAAMAVALADPDRVPSPQGERLGEPVGN